MLINHPSNHKIDLKEILCQVRILTTQINELGQNLNLTVNEIRTALASNECSTLEVTCLNLIAAELEAALEKVQICRTQVTYKSLQLHPDLPNLTPQAKRRWKLKKKTLHKNQGKDIIVDAEISQAMQTLQRTEAECRSVITKIVAGTQQEQIITALNQYLKQLLNLDEIPNLETLNADDLNVTESQYLLQTDSAIICPFHPHGGGIAASYQALLNIAIQKSELYQQLQQANLQLENLVMVDQLTQIPNRRFFDQQLDKIWRELFREQYYLSLLICDIDYFKLYNDNYGHAGGDACLRLVAQAFKQAAKRSMDVIARYGGEEFAVILPKTDSKGADWVAQQIHQVIQDLNIPHIASTVKPFLTLSIGIVTVIPTSDMIPLDLIEAADQALYEAKAQGRNRSFVGQIFFQM